MVINLKIIKNTTSELSEDKTEQSSFMTSLDTIQKVMNVPMCALTSLLRSNGYDSIDNTSSLCIDEKKLEIFVLAYKRKIRSYFISSLRNINKLNQNELNSFKKFVELFKNKDLKGKPAKWSDIDTEHLRKAFIENVKRNTPSKFIELLESCTLFASSKMIIAQATLSNSRNEEFHDTNFNKEDFVLNEIVHSYYYVTKLTYIRQEWHICTQFKNIYKAARYHIFSSDSEDENINQIS